MNPLNASQSTVCGLAWKRYSRQTPLRDVAPALNGRASLARVRPCRTAAASFMVGRGYRYAFDHAALFPWVGKPHLSPDDNLLAVAEDALAFVVVKVIAFRTQVGDLP